MNPNKDSFKNEKGQKSFWKKLWEDWGGMLYMVPVLAGIALFTITPMITSLYYSLHEYIPQAKANKLRNFGLDNFIKMFKGGRLEVLKNSLFVTFRFAILNVGIGLTGSYILALFLNQKTKGIQVFRVVYYLPCIIPALAGTLLWKDVTAIPDGYLNQICDKIFGKTFKFYSSGETVLPTLLFVSVFTFGGNAIMWLAQMKNVPTELYESADLDGANYFHKLFYITIPQTTSMLFYLLVMSIIGSLQAFGNVYPLKGSLNADELNFLGVMIYENAFKKGEWSYACALSWFLFFIIGLLTTFIFKTSKWVYYGEDA